MENKVNITRLIPTNTNRMFDLVVDPQVLKTPILPLLRGYMDINHDNGVDLVTVDPKQHVITLIVLFRMVGGSEVTIGDLVGWLDRPNGGGLITITPNQGDVLFDVLVYNLYKRKY